MQLGETDVLQLVKDTDFGGARPQASPARWMLVVGLLWVAFQMWYASPIPFSLPSGFRFGLFNDTEARSIHLALGLFSLSWRFLHSSVRRVITFPGRTVFAVAGAATALYLIVFYKELSLRPGNPTGSMSRSAIVGVLLLLEARAGVGLPMAILGGAVPRLCDGRSDAAGLVAHKGASVPRVVSHMWMVTEGVSSLRSRVGELHLRLRAVRHAARPPPAVANYICRLSFALLGHLRGGRPRSLLFRRAQRPDLWLVGQQRRVRRHFHDPADEARWYGGVKAAAIENLIVGQWPDHAAGDGCGAFLW